jgi:hypothetical protein
MTRAAAGLVIFGGIGAAALCPIAVLAVWLIARRLK